MCSSTPQEAGSVANAGRRISVLAEFIAPTAAAPGHGIVLSQHHPLVMLNLRGPGSPAFCEGARLTCGCELPRRSNASSSCESGTILKLGPDEWLLVAGSGTHWSENMAIESATLTDVSHARVALNVGGEKSREMLAKGCAVDLHPRYFPDGMCIQTSIAKISVIIHKLRNGNDFALYAGRSYAASLWHWLTAASAEYGYHVAACPKRT